MILGVYSCTNILNQRFGLLGLRAPRDLPFYQEVGMKLESQHEDEWSCGQLGTPRNAETS